MHLAAIEFRQAVESFFAVLVPETEHRKRNKHLVGMQTRVFAVEQAHFGGLDWLYHGLRNEFHIVSDACDMLGSVEYQGGAGA